jgi:uncharacterized protein (UPF0332 family)
VTPGQAEEARSELDRAKRALEEARVLLVADSLEGAASRLYYAAFHATRAALIVRGRSTKTHSGQISMFTEVYGTAPILGRLLDLRARADYGFGELPITREGMGEYIIEAEAFLGRCGDIVADAAERGADEPDPPPDY